LPENYYINKLKINEFNIQINKLVNSLKYNKRELTKIYLNDSNNIENKIDGGEGELLKYFENEEKEITRLQSIIKVQETKINEMKNMVDELKKENENIISLNDSKLSDKSDDKID